ncbi:glycosyltransferase family 2 protein [Novipirellula artificiosorum]|uniref:Undecaprenyl-phosphate 4-deoxy-4-formamido-L-arabinose transferase n=1 Tax=Novipirellula artificiosorum TaxID=2528016 RepID=A0A5C6DCQ5_9BACT|nr:glycosyltransferase family 2 protein [Novipirellula artificiosorum]TWU35013.1 Undecaprenyl-phosphate 4-deoxy-4-formamido-L-arabinose transferase [Novipirellula artificiosorum]
MHCSENSTNSATSNGGVPSSQATISLILPAWNESEVIERAIAEADAALRPLSVDYEIIVVDDGSTDQTASLVAQAAIRNPAVRLVRHNPNQGYGAAIRSGFAAAQKNLVVFTDADCQFDLTELDRFVLLSKRYDIVCGYRIDRKDSALRCFYSQVYNLLVRILLRTDVRDVDCALKMFHRNVVKKLTISGNGFLVNSEILTSAKQQGYRVVEVGVSHRPRIDGTSTVSVHHIPKVLASLARFWWSTVLFPADNPRRGSGLVMIGSEASPREIQADAGNWLFGRAVKWVPVGLLLLASLFVLMNLSHSHPTQRKLGSQRETVTSREPFVKPSGSLKATIAQVPNAGVRQ